LQQGFPGVIRDRLTRERAETIGLNGLAFLAGRQDDLERFLANAGIGPEELRLRAGDPDMLRAVTEFLLSDDPLLNAFCEEHELRPQEVHVAAHELNRP
jgi:hypothetical protein